VCFGKSVVDVVKDAIRGNFSGGGLTNRFLISANRLEPSFLMAMAAA
jgi:hypothetical protein